MSEYRNALRSPKLVKMVAAVVVGLSIGTLLPPEPVAVPGVGPVPGLAVGGVGLLAGAVLYLKGPALVGTGCGCATDCGCA
jgi:hypothetical protein